MTTKTKTDREITRPHTSTVCIVGGGPAGMVLGYMFARQGITVTVLDEWAMLELKDVEASKYKDYARVAMNYITQLALLAQEAYPNAVDKIKVQKPLSEQGWF